MSEIGGRVIVIGSSGSGKSTLGEALARRLGAPFVELDALNWEPGWVEAPTDTLRARVRDATAGDSWIVAGNYTTKTQDLTWPRAEAIVFLDYPLRLILWRLLRRSWRRWRTHELLWGTNTESFWKHFTSWNDSLLVWALRTHGRHRRRWPGFLADPRWSHIRFVRLRSPRETARWLEAAAPAGRRAG